MLLGAEGAPVLEHALELLAFSGLLVEHLLERGAQRHQNVRAEHDQLRAGRDEAIERLGIARVITRKHFHQRVRAGGLKRNFARLAATSGAAAVASQQTLLVGEAGLKSCRRERCQRSRGGERTNERHDRREGL